VIALGLLVVLIGFAVMVPRNSVPGTTAHRNVSLGMQRVFQTPGYDGTPSIKYRIIQVLVGLAMIAGGLAIIANAT
jgi:hypothetical protein